MEDINCEWVFHKSVVILRGLDSFVLKIESEEQF